MTKKTTKPKNDQKTTKPKQDNRKARLKSGCSYRPTAEDMREDVSIDVASEQLVQAVVRGGAPKQKINFLRPRR
jgi:hypothetical protein